MCAAGGVDLPSEVSQAARQIVCAVLVGGGDDSSKGHDGSMFRMTRSPSGCSFLNCADPGAAFHDGHDEGRVLRADHCDHSHAHVKHSVHFGLG